MARVLGWLAHALDAVWGHRCRLGCGRRVFRRDVEAHERIDHAGDLTEQGRRLASERDDLIAHGADPTDLVVPLAPDPEGDPG